MRKQTPLTAAVFVFIFLLPVPLIADGQGWMSHSAAFKIDSKFSLKLTRETRFHETTYMDPYLQNWQGGGVVNLPKSFYFSFLYKRENVQKTGFVLAENRFSLESGWKIGLSREFNFDWRFRVEIRRFENQLAENHLRFRMRFRIKTSVRIGSLEIKPFIATEPFSDTLSNQVFRNRFYLGAGFSLSEKVELVINYIRQDTKGKETLHILNSGFDLKF